MDCAGSCGQQYFLPSGKESSEEHSRSYVTSARRKVRRDGGQIDLGQAPVERGLFARLVLGGQQAGRFRFVFGAEALLARVKVTWR